MEINKQGIKLIKYYEGFRPESYICEGGKNTIGYGHVIRSDENYKDRTITLEEGQELLMEDVDKFEKSVTKLVKAPINDNQFSALVSFAYNLGSNNLRKSTLLQNVNNKMFMQCPPEFLRWIYTKGKPLKGLLRRRCSEALLFIS